ncbi:MAG: hypothetical protein FJZ56_07245 [Chlamydiae bacterium]|nr:hypothetical protein [Chlamydiota bacterium]
MINNPELIRKAYMPGGYKSNVKFVICWNHPQFIDKQKFFAIPDEKRIGIFWEPRSIIKEHEKSSVINRYKMIFTFRDDWIDNHKFFKLAYPSLLPMAKDIPDFHDRELACIITGSGVSQDPLELYSLRREVIDFYEKKEDCGFGFYGRNWPLNVYKNYKGSPANKTPVLKSYKFSYCFENSKETFGYITEKIFDCFHAGCVPIYYGAPNVTDYIPENCFIDMRGFQSIEEAHNFISEMTEDVHNQYIKNISAFLESPEAQVFTEKTLFESLIPALINS